MGRAKKKNTEGQASVLIAVMTLTLVFFFAFVVNIGMLVNAKINLQNAADLAAYAGAAVQARQLTQISYLNYEMRRQYKKFLYRYYVLGNMSKTTFPKTGAAAVSGRTPMFWSPNGNAANDYNVPAVCVIFNPTDNYCQVPTLTKIVIPARTSADAINDALIGALEKLEQFRTENCNKIGFTNTQLLYQWLWNADPDYSQVGTLPSYASDPNIQQALAVVRSLSLGLGLIPKEILLWRRAQTLATYVNEPAKTGVNLEKIDELRSEDNREPLASERTIQAFLSAYYTLGNHTFNAGDVRMDELLPESILRLGDTRVKFDAYAFDLTVPPGGQGDCTGTIQRDGVDNGLPVAVYKDPAFLTYYAVRLRAKARLLFSPFGEVEMKAYAAAMPFGSRIGPQLTDGDFLRKGANLTNIAVAPGVNVTGQIPNLKIAEDDTTAKGGGWDTREVMGALYQALNPPGSPPQIPASVDANTLQRAYHTAMAPNPYERRFYNIPYDGDDPFVRNFDTQKVLSFLAPVFPEREKSQLASRIEDLVTQMTPGAGANPVAAQNRAVLTQTLQLYMNRLIGGRGEEIDLRPAGSTAASYAEGFRITRIADPVFSRPGDGADLRVMNIPGFIMNDPKQIRSSWNDVNDSRNQAAGRIGYSVKFVAFEYLRGNARGNDQATIQNQIPETDGEAEFDIPALKH